MAVVEHLVNVHSIAGERLQARGYGEGQPLVPNDSDERRAQNRRVDLVKLGQ